MMQQSLEGQPTYKLFVVSACNALIQFSLAPLSFPLGFLVSSLHSVVETCQGQVPAVVTNDQLKSVFAQYGEVREVAILKDRVTDKSKGKR
jgi:hypothetical protein